MGSTCVSEMTERVPTRLGGKSCTRPSVEIVWVVTVLTQTLIGVTATQNCLGFTGGKLAASQIIIFLIFQVYSRD